jgi:hypothetical protein
MLSEVWRKNIIPNEIIHSPGPGFIRIAPKIGAFARDKFLTGYISDVNIHIQDEVGDFLHGSGDGQVCADLAGKSYIAAPARLQIRLMRSGFDRPDIDNLKPSRLGKSFAQLIAYHFQPGFFFGARAIGLTIEAGVDEFEIEDRNALCCKCWRSPRKQAQHGEEEKGDLECHLPIP